MGKSFRAQTKDDSVEIWKKTSAGNFFSQELSKSMTRSFESSLNTGKVNGSFFIVSEFRRDPILLLFQETANININTNANANANSNDKTTVLLLINDGHCSLQGAALTAATGVGNPRLSQLTTKGGRFPGRVSFGYFRKKSGGENSPMKSFHFSTESLPFIFGLRGQLLLEFLVTGSIAEAGIFFHSNTAKRRCSIYQYQSVEFLLLLVYFGSSHRL